jgi:hypothetical protein
MFAHDLLRPCFARRSGLREGGKPVSIPDQVEDKLFGIMRVLLPTNRPLMVLMADALESP